MKRWFLVALIVLALLISNALAIIELKETSQEITSNSWTETRRLETNEYRVYKFQGISTNIVNVSLEVVRGDSMDTFLMVAEDFINYQSMMRSGRSNQFNSYLTGKGMNIKYISYSFEIPATSTYYIIIDNTVLPNNGGQPGGSMDVQIKFTKSRCLKCEEIAGEIQNRTEEANRQSEEVKQKLDEMNKSKEPKSSSGFTAVYSILVLVTLLYLVKKR